MRKFFILCLVILVGILLISASVSIPGKKVQDIRYLQKIEKTGVKTSANIKMSPDFGKIPLYFIPNKGQVNEKAKFYAKTSRYTLWMTKKGLVFDSVHTPPFGHPSREGINKTPHSPHSTNSPGSLQRDVSRVIFLNANPKPEMMPVEMTQHKVNYFIGTDPSKWQKGISTSKAVLYKNIYKNIDLTVYGNERQIEYDWIVRPGGIPEDIRFEYKNVKSAQIDRDGNLVIETKFGRLIHKKPVSYQVINKEKIKVESGFRRINKLTYGFRIHEYNKDYELIIDPVVSLVYSTYLGGSNDELYTRMTIDDLGQVHLTGYTYSYDFPVRNAYQDTKASSLLDAILTKFNSTGSELIFSTYFGGSSSEYFFAITVSGNGDVYIAGDTFSSDLPAINSRIGGKDVFIARFASDGNFLGGRYLGGSSEDRNLDIVLDDGSNYLFVTGFTRSSDFPTINAYQDTLSGSSCVYVTKLTYDLSNIVYSTYLGGMAEDVGNCIAVDNSGYFYVYGRTGSTDLPLKNPWQSHYGGGAYDVFVTKFEPDGSDLVFSTFLGGSGAEYSHSLAVDSSHSVFMGGFTESTDFPTKNPYQETNGGYRDIFITQLSSDGSELLYSTYLGGTGEEGGGDLTPDSFGDIYVSGCTTSSNFPTKNPYQSTHQGNFDAFLSILSPGGEGLVYSTFFGGSNWDYCLNIARDGSGNIYIAGNTASSDFPVLDAYQLYKGGAEDAFVARFSPATCTLTVQSTPDTGVPITVTPNDINGNGDGNTDFTRTYNPGEVVTLTAPETFNNKVFYKWTIDGVDNLNLCIQVTMDSNHTVTAVYQTPSPTCALTVRSTPHTGVPITTAPNDINGRGNGYTNFARTYNPGEVVMLTAPEVFNNNIFYKWTIDGINNFNRTIQLTMDNNHTVTAVYQVPPPTWILTVQSIPDKGVPVTVFPDDMNGNGDGNTDFTRTYHPGEVVTLTAPQTFNDKIFYKWTSDGQDNFNPGIQVTMDSNCTVTAVYQTPAEIVISRTHLYFGANTSGTTTGDQTFIISKSGESILDWDIIGNASWLNCSPTSGTDAGEVTVSVEVSGLLPGTFTRTLMVSDPDASNSPQTIDVTLTVYNTNECSAPFGFFETPRDGAYVYGSIPVTGWALDDIEVERVKIYREDGKDLVYIGDAVFVEGARPDVELAYPTYPKSYRAGWGYMMLTNFLPDGGNGTFVIYAIAEDKEGNKVTLGKKTIICDNAHAVRPFGAIDTPIQGGTASGSSYVNFGWVLTPQPNYIPTDGSTINVWIDGVNIGNPVYNNYRADIAALFPGYANSNGAVGYFNIDTTQYENGVHTIQWTALDSAGNVDGIGSRYFAIQNTGESRSQEKFNVQRSTFNVDIAQIPADHYQPVRIKEDVKENIKYKTIYPNKKGITTLHLKELQRVEIHLAGPGRRDGKGYLLVGDRLRPLPIGSTFDAERGVFYWLPGPGFIGTYRLVFIEERSNGEMRKKFINVEIVPKFMKKEK
ncbi:MAG: hypothetical protein GTO45_21285 [Candidatus Aminicenantes bacterium]|nr:hypothetical protein [Candidatus Aminicenantes bacterium]NIM81295.1 hypothetical protein [Candidatus Aminicenantes bacterium]NIN20699.1 hypothetical protein [Candidatus Aminicenantes bacterium]NIN44475.1 hypothetical protein [Candidatus Aminicenantes bacterium]NIN87297.1 hypothetical protein [Candidatus Aminicenantes bacterium]